MIEDKKSIIDQIQAIVQDNIIIFEHLNIHILDNEKVNINYFKKFINSLNFKTLL